MNSRNTSTVKPVLNSHSKMDQKLLFKTKYRLIQVKSIAESAILSTFIKLPFVSKIFILSIFEWPLKTSFTVGFVASTRDFGTSCNCESA